MSREGDYSDDEILAILSRGNPVEAAIKAEGVAPDDAELYRSIAQQESSNGKNTATSNAGAKGWTQIIPDTFKAVADKGWDINDEYNSAQAGLRELIRQKEMAGGDATLAAAGYYGGRGAAIDAAKGIPHKDKRNPNAPDTLEYANQVVSRVEPDYTDEEIMAMLAEYQAQQPTQQPTQPTANPVSQMGQLMAAPPSQGEPPSLGQALSNEGQAFTAFLKDSIATGKGGLQNLLHGMAPNMVSAPDPASVMSPEAYAKLSENYPAASMALGAGKIAGSLALPVSSLPAAALSSGALSALRWQPGETPQSQAGRTMTSMGIGGLLSKVMPRGMRVDDDAQKLIDQGITLTPGQMAGAKSMTKGIEDKATSLPFVGNMIDARRYDALKQFSSNRFNHALNPIGEKVSGKNGGFDAFIEASEKIGTRYQNALNPLSIKLPNPQTYKPELSKRLPKAYQQRFASAFGDAVEGLGKGGVTNGADIQAAQSILKLRTRAFEKSTDPLDNIVADHLRQASKNITAKLPQSTQQEINKIDMAFARMKTLEDSVNRAGVKDALVTPNNLLGVIRNKTKNSDYAEGKGFGQDFAATAARVLPSGVPDSGTAGRAAMLMALTGGAYATNTPIFTPSAVLLGTLGGTKAGQKIVKSMMFGKKGDAINRLLKSGAVMESGNGLISDFLGE